MGKKVDGGFTITTGSGQEFYAKKLIFATGIRDILPGIKGFTGCWGISVIHCPYCHGYEFKGKNTSILANGARAVHLASLVSNLTDKLCILTNGEPDFTADQMIKFEQHHISVVKTTLSEIEHNNGSIEKVIFSDGTSRSFDAIYAALPFVQHSDIPASFGCEFTENGYLKVGMFQETNINGIYACGDNSNMMRSVALAVSTGNIAGAVVNGKLVEEQF